jgi:hypothetical protein
MLDVLNVFRSQEKVSGFMWDVLWEQHSQNDRSVTDHLFSSVIVSRWYSCQNREYYSFSVGVGDIKTNSNQTLRHAVDGSDGDRAILQSCIGILFFGVPNQGLDNPNMLS